MGDDQDAASGPHRHQKRMVEAGMPASEAFALSGLVASDE